MNHLTPTFCLLILWGLAYIFSYNKKPKKKGDDEPVCTNVTSDSFP